MSCQHIIRCAVDDEGRAIAEHYRAENPALAVAMLAGPCVSAGNDATVSVAEFLYTIAPSLGWETCSYCGRENACIHPDSEAQAGEPVCMDCVKGGAFDA